MNFRLGPFNNSVRQLSFTVSIVSDNIPEDEEKFNVSLRLDPADQARLGNRTRVTVSPDVATVTIQDDEGNTWLHLLSTTMFYQLLSNLMMNCQDHNTHVHEDLFHHTLWCV